MVEYMDTIALRDQLEKALGDVVDNLLLTTILTHLTSDEVKEFVDLLLAERYAEAEAFLISKLPDLEEKAKDLHSQYLKGNHD